MTRGHASEEGAFADREELFFRQAPDAFHEKGRVSQQAFIPRRDDEGKLSGNLSSVTTAKVASEYRATARGKDPQRVWGLAVTEIQRAGLSVEDDSALMPDIDLPPGHASLDYGVFMSTPDADALIEDAAADFAILANTRGRLYPSTVQGAQGIAFPEPTA